MERHRSLIITLILCVLLEKCTQAETVGDMSVKNKSGDVIIVKGKMEITDKSFELHYQIRNKSEKDIWICDDSDLNGWDFEVYLVRDDRTLKIRRRMNVPEYTESYGPRIGKYVRLRAGEDRTESLSLPLPIYPRYTYWSGGGMSQGIEHARNLALEIEYYKGDFPEMIRSIIEKAEKVVDNNTDENLALIRRCISGLLQFNELNESVMLRHRDEEVLVPYTYQALKGEQVLRIMVEEISIPYSEKLKPPKLSFPDIKGCIRIEVQYQSSVLDYFFTYPDQQNLMNSTERQYLQSLNKMEVNDPECIEAFASELSKGMLGGIVNERSTAHVVCYRDGKHLTSFTIYDNTSIVTEEKYRLRYIESLLNLKVFTPQIKTFGLRVECANNLFDLYRRCLSHKIKKNESSYPSPTGWCDSIVQTYNNIGMLEVNIQRPFRCLSAGEGKCHYAMNINCKPDSPPDMVLLFETKDGWNQHGGPELFTFDNHNPRGGCVLLNDGTVKFIRTQKNFRN